MSTQDKIIQKIKEIYDPELPVNIYDLGLIYAIELDETKKRVHLLMTLTSPNCPVADTLPGLVQSKVEELKELEQVTLELTFDPPYTPDRLSEDAKIILGWEDERDE